MSVGKAVKMGACGLALLSFGAIAPAGAAVAEREAPLSWSAEEIRRVLQHSPLPAPPPDPTNRVADDPRAACLGQMLFFEPRLSANGRFSCASCHVPHHGFTDGHALAEGVGMGTHNTPSLWNVAYNRWFFWDGRADTLWSQALQPIEHATELGGNRVEVARLLASDRVLRSAYEVVFGAPPEMKGPFGAAPAEVDEVFAHVGKALAAYQRRLISCDSRFDRFARALRDRDMAGQRAYSATAQRGLKLFLGKGECRLCHSGPSFSDGEFHDTGVPARSGLAPDLGRLAGVEKLLLDPWNAAGAYSDDRSGPTAARLRHLVASRETRGQFKTPGLRNVALSAPYMHQGQLETLRQVLGYYATLRGAAFHHDPPESLLAPRHFNDGEITDLISFLESLTDEGIEPELLRAPPVESRLAPKVTPELGRVGDPAVW